MRVRVLLVGMRDCASACAGVRACFSYRAHARVRVLCARMHACACACAGCVRF
jgi:hypothetical protein